MNPTRNNRTSPQHPRQTHPYSTNHNEDPFTLLMTPPPVQIGNTVYRNSNAGPTSQTHQQSRQHNYHHTRPQYSNKPHPRGHSKPMSISKPPPLVTRPSLNSANTSTPSHHHDRRVSQGEERGYDWSRHFPVGIFQPLNDDGTTTNISKNQSIPPSRQPLSLRPYMQVSLNPESQAFIPTAYIPLQYMPSPCPHAGRASSQPPFQQPRERVPRPQPSPQEVRFCNYSQAPMQYQSYPMQSMPLPQPQPQPQADPQPQPQQPQQLSLLSSQSVRPEVRSSQIMSTVKSQKEGMKVELPSSSATITRNNDDDDKKDCEDDNMCIICMENPKDASLIHGDSGHIICCLTCANALKSHGDVCPVCRAPIDLVVKNYYG